MADVRFFLDENMQVVIAEQVERRGIDVVHITRLGLQGTQDPNVLKHATEMGRILCTHDIDFAELALAGAEHTGIIIGQADTHTVGDWVRGLTLYHAVYTAEEFTNRLEWL